MRCVEQKDVVADDIGLKSFGRREGKLRLPKKKINYKPSLKLMRFSISTNSNNNYL